MKEINIISFDVPYPPNYGGIIDVFYKIKYFHSKGVKVHLHCFEYGRGTQNELNKYCETVNYYKRKVGIPVHLSTLPYIVKSRISDQLKHNLLKNDFPILFEGLHTTYLLNDEDFSERLKIFREHNIEHEYYEQLALVESNPIKKLYYYTESKKLKRYEKIITKADLSLILSSTDLNYFRDKYPQNRFAPVSSFHRSNDINIKQGTGDYVLYHGNLSVAENHYAAKFIITNIFNQINIPLIIAGLNPGIELINMVRQHDNITLIPNPSDKDLDDLIANAQINLLYTNQATGLKLKLLNALYNGRHCIVNSKMVEGTSLSEACTVKDSVNDLKQAIQDLFESEVSTFEINKRKRILTKDYSNENNFNTIQSLLYYQY